MSETGIHRITNSNCFVTVSGGTPKKSYHQIGAVRRNQNISLANCARKLGLTVQEARNQEQPDSNLTLAQLMAWKKVLDVPMSELVPDDDFIEDPVKNRALLLRVMKTAQQILNANTNVQVHRMAVTLVDQLIELMPELANVSPWPEVGQSHASRGLGKTAYRHFDSELESLLDSE